MKLTCAHCSVEFERCAGHVNRQRRVAGENVPFFCSQACSGARRRQSIEEKKRKKSEYDRLRREELAEELRVKRKEYHRRTYNPAKAAEKRKDRMGWHVEYCRRYYADPDRKQAKVKYDFRQRNKELDEEWQEAFAVLLELEREVRRLIPNRYERMKARGYYDNPLRQAQARKRQCQTSR